MTATLAALPAQTCRIPGPASVLARLRSLVPQIQARARCHDAHRAFPAEDLESLRKIGALRVFGAKDVPPLDLMEALRLAGRSNLSVGRIFEGHVNGAALIASHGSETQRIALSCALAQGRVFGVWNTEPGPGVAVRVGEDGEPCLTGCKSFATGAGHIDYAIVTARLPDGGRQMVLVQANDAARADPSVWRVRGMRATVSGTYDLTGLPAGPAARLGVPGDYEREPRFSAGAWRFAAVQLGGVERVVGLLRDHLAASATGEDPVHRARFARALRSARSAYLWVREAAQRAEAPDAGPAEVAFVLMARGVVEDAGLEAMEAAARSVGTRAFFEDHPLDQACRDLALYLRQPAPDQALDRAATAFLATDCWRDDPLW
jgi:alkylation response protein AidB-like acyl-CoA dehydrogenase